MADFLLQQQHQQQLLLLSYNNPCASCCCFSSSYARDPSSSRLMHWLPLVLGRSVRARTSRGPGLGFVACTLTRIMASSHLPPDHGVAAGSIPVVAPRAGAPRHKVEKTTTTTTTTTGTAHSAHHTGGGGLAALAHLNSVRDMFALNAADSAGAAAVVDDGAEVEEEEREVASDTFRSTALISSREQVSI
jgi:hypothetical protein